ncbi:MAG: hypothetical protein Q6373_009110, partial [Candidatus Sigynarchaeota archaeon]
AIVSHQDRRQASGSSGSSRKPRTTSSRGEQKSQERPAGRRIAVGKDGLPMYCDACGNLLYRDGDGFACRACGHIVKEPGS